MVCLRSHPIVASLRAPLGYGGIADCIRGEKNSPVHRSNLSGEVKDVLARSGISLAGSFKLDVADLLTGAAALKAAGILRGKLAVSDASGSLRIETFSMRPRRSTNRPHRA